MGRIAAGWVTAMVASGVLGVAGVIVFVSSIETPASFGWYAYQPLSGAVFAPRGGVVFTPLSIVAGVVGVLGLMGLAALIGYSLGRRRPTQS